MNVEDYITEINRTVGAGDYEAAQSTEEAMYKDLLCDILTRDISSVSRAKIKLALTVDDMDHPRG